MSNDVNLKLIRDEFMLGSEKEEAFKNICRKLGLNSPSFSKICNWFGRIHASDLSLKDEIGSFHYKLLHSIVTQYSKFKYAMFYRQDLEWTLRNETLIQDRYKLIASGESDSFIIHDTFNKEEKSFQTGIDKIIRSRYFFPTVINYNRVLLNVLESSNDAEYLVLLNVDFDELKCKVLDKFALNFVCGQIIMDSMNDMEFLLRDLDEQEEINDTSFYKGRLVDDKIHIDSHGHLFRMRPFYCKFMNGSLSVFQYNSDEGISDWQFVEYNLNLNSARKVNVWSITETQIDMESFMDHEGYVWQKRKLYTACSDDTTFSISIFDADLREWTKLKFIGSGYVGKVAIDGDEILTICATEDRYYDILKPKTVYRIPMRKPDKLRYLAWSTIRRGELFFGSTLYERLMPKLPLNSEFHPFSEY